MHIGKAENGYSSEIRERFLSLVYMIKKKGKQLQLKVQELHKVKVYANTTQSFK
jgi:hypothetical protein